MAPYWAQKVDCIYFAILLTSFFNSLIAAGQQQAPVATTAIPPIKILIPKLPPSHYQFWLKNNPSALNNFEKICSESAFQDTNDLEKLVRLNSSFTFEDPRFTNDLSFGKKLLDTICSKINLVRKSCWGYETNCDIIYLMPECQPSSSDTQSEQEKKIEWFSQADFGYILDRRRELSRYCAPDKHSNHSIKSSLECTKYFNTCRGENLYVRFDDSQTILPLQDGPMMVKKGQVGGWNCDLQKKRIQEEGTQRGFLKSWFNELKSYHLIEPSKTCKERIEKQVYFIQLDSSASMYHYFRNFLNLYATMHLNNRFSEDTELILWDKKLPQSQFEVMWSVFSKNSPKSLKEFRGKQVCFNKFIFTMPPRMIHGLYYNTQLVEGCSKSGLFDAFNKHVLYKLGIHDDELKTTGHSNIRVTIVSRSTPARKILNENELRAAADGISTEFRTQIVDFANMTFLDQLRISHNTDILVGIHGAGLTHTLFLPDWAALFELYDCKDERYRGLARLRGVGYFTLEDGGDLGDTPMDRDFSVDVVKFVEKLRLAGQEIKKRRGDPMKNLQADAKPSSKEETEAIKREQPKSESKQQEQQPHTEL